MDVQQIKCELQKRLFWKGSELKKNGRLNRNFFLVFLLAQSVLVTLADPVVSLLFQSVLIFSSFFFSFYIVGGVTYNICPMPDIRSNSRISAYLCLPKCECLLVMLFLRVFLEKENQYFPVLADERL